MSTGAPLSLMNPVLARVVPSWPKLPSRRVAVRATTEMSSSLSAPVSSTMRVPKRRDAGIPAPQDSSILEGLDDVLLEERVMRSELRNRDSPALDRAVDR